MNEQFSTVSQADRKSPMTVIPLVVREDMGLKKGSRLVWKKQNGGWLVTLTIDRMRKKAQEGQKE